MALSLYSERPAAAAASLNPLALVAGWIAKVRAERVRRVALMSLLQLDRGQLQDLGISRGDVVDALRTPSRAACALNDARAANSRL